MSKPTLTPEQRAAMAERMKRQRQDPAFEARRKAALTAAYADDVVRCEIRKKIAEANREQWKDPVIRRKRLAAIAKGLDQGVREKRAALLAERRKDPQAEAKRLAALRKKFEETKAKRRAVAIANAQRRRGFAVPARLWADYKALLRKGLLAREAGIALGIVRQ